ncbi:CD209 antigen-like protein A isoform X1 [Oreochromis niloticus]|uniref:CD209 antigen-like protein A isoform X1 n=1 Tax=Oreochromis niloticus TaxID=8128 RepID=UPI000905208D|nr:CD209 antigen-like protein A isoform X1 [Oreochromis niloticus]
MDCESGADNSTRKRKLCRLVVLSFALLCILQATLNISLRLAFYSSDTTTTPDCEAIIKNLTKQQDMRMNELARYSLQGWLYFNHSLYYVSSTKNTWNDSREDCLQRGADLVIINSREEQNFIREFKKRTWIGLTDAEKEQTWKWVDGTTLTISFWDTGEPNSYEGIDEDCGEIFFYTRENSWNDQPCDSKNVWICEKKM